MLKPKHYPHATIAAAVFLTAAPLSLLFLSALWRPAPHVDFQKSVSQRAASESRLSSETRKANPIITPDRDRSSIEAPTRTESQSGSAVAESPAAGTNTQRTPRSDVAPLRPFTAETSILSVRADKPAIASVPGSSEAVTKQSAARPAPVASMRPDMTADPLVAPNKVAIVPEPAQPDTVEEPEYPAMPVVSESYFMSTGHLALADVPQTLPPAVTPDDAVTAVDEESEGPRKPKKMDLVPKNGSPSKTSEPVSTMASAAEPPISKESTSAVPMAADKTASRTVPLPTPATAVVPDFGEDEFFGTTGRKSRTASVGGPDGNVLLEDVILQTPLETRQVGRVENVIGVTGARGFPIALVRSDLPDDDWWVQQMVGMRGNTFAARVNFGNDESISGSVYHMVVVFLDSPDEARRFRIAKRFDELPEGIRRSREFRYVRK